jgi:hypothetical protein
MRSALAVSTGLLLLCTFQFSASAFPHQTMKTTSTVHVSGLTNSDVVRMVNAKFDDPTIVKTIEMNETYFDVSVDALLRLKEQGVSQTVIQAMLSASKKSPSPQPTAQPAQATMEKTQVTYLAHGVELPDEVGVYQLVKGKLVAIEPEIVNWRTGGVVKNAVTLGLDKGHVNGTVSGPHSKTALATTPFGMAGSIVFYIHCLEGNSVSEYQLLRFWQKSDRREFRSVTGGVLHMSGGATDNLVEFQFEKIGPRTYKVELPSLALGEYGFLAPGAAASADMASRGKIYTFRVIE